MCRLRDRTVCLHREEACGAEELLFIEAVTLFLFPALQTTARAHARHTRYLCT